MARISNADFGQMLEEERGSVDYPGEVAYSVADTAMIPWAPEVLRGERPVEPVAAFTPLTDLAQNIQEIKAKQAELERARTAEQATRAASAAAQAPKIEAAQAGLAPSPQIAAQGERVAQATEDVRGQLARQPSRGLTPFLAPIEGEPAETSIAKLLQGIGLLATGVSGLARGDARAALASMQGALKGWQAGDKIRADRAFSDWKAATEGMLAKWDVEHKTYRDLMEQRGKSVEELLTDAKLEALKQGNQVAVDAFASQSVEKSLDYLTKTQAHADSVALKMAQLTAADASRKTAEAIQLQRLDMEREANAQRERGVARLEREETFYHAVLSRLGFAAPTAPGPGAPGTAGTIGGATMEPPKVSVGKGGISLEFEPRRLGEEDKKALRVYDTTMDTINELNRFTAKEIATYVGLMNRPVQEAKRLVPGLQNERYEQFRAVVSRLKGTAFAEGGKQLTRIELAVVTGYTPTGEEPNIEAFLAKVEGLRRYTTARRSLVSYYSRRGIDPSQVPETEWDQAMRLGLGLPGAPPAGAPGPPAAEQWERGPDGKLRKVK